MFDFKLLGDELAAKKYVLNDLKLDFNEKQLDYIYDTTWSFYIGGDEQKKIAFKKESFVFEKDWENFKFIKIKFDKKDFYVFLNFFMYFLIVFCNFNLNLNDNYKYSANLLENREENYFKIDETYIINKQLFIDLFKNLKNENNILIIDFNDETSERLLMFLVFIDFSYKTITNPKLDLSEYFFHNLDKYINSN